MKVLKERFPYRWCESDDSDAGWIDKFNMMTKRYQRIYDCDSPLQLVTSMEDFDYTLWLDDQPCYRGRRGNSIRNPYQWMKIGSIQKIEWH